MSANRPRSGLSALLLATVTVLLAGCGGGSGHGGSDFTFLNIDLFSVGGTSPVSSVNSNVDLTNFSTIVCATLRNNLKNPTVTAPTPLDNVTITSYTVTIARLDGGPPPGPFTFNTAFTVPAGVPPNNTARIPVVLVPAQAKRQPPLGNPRPRLPLSATADIVFRGRNGRGQNTSVEGTISVNFIADDTATSEPTAC